MAHQTGIVKFEWKSEEADPPILFASFSVEKRTPQAHFLMMDEAISLQIERAYNEREAVEAVRSIHHG